MRYKNHQIQIAIFPEFLRFYFSISPAFLKMSS